MTQSRSLTRCLGWALTAMLPALAVFGVLAPGARPDNQANESIELLFLYGSEKEAWVKEVTPAFQATIDGRPVHVTAVPMGSGETILKLLDGDMKAHLISPASTAYLELGNSWAKDKGQKLLVHKPWHNLVQSPVVIAMWRPMAEALGWRENKEESKEIGWADLRKLAKKGWGAWGHPNWGPLKFGHTHPEMSNSGLIALLAQVYAATRKDKLTVEDVKADATGAFLEDLESSVVHYGESTGFFAKKMFDRGGRSVLHAAVLYENLVIESYGDKYKDKLQGEGKVVAIYPKEGTFLSDHPVAVVDRDWVSDVHRQAARKYIEFLRQDAQQLKALKLGFRPGVARVRIGAPIDSKHGVDPDKPTQLLEVPEAKVMEACLESWKKYKKKAFIVVVIDRSYATSFNNMLFKVRDSAEALFGSLNPGDRVTVLAFGDDVDPLAEDVEIGGEADKKALQKKLKSLVPKGNRKLFDAIAKAHRHLQEHKDKAGKIAGVLVVACDEKDGGIADGGSSLTLDKLLDQIRVGKDSRNDIPVCVFSYPTADGVTELKKIADETKAPLEMVKDDTTEATVRKVLRKLAAFF